MVILVGRYGMGKKQCKLESASGFKFYVEGRAKFLGFIGLTVFIRFWAWGLGCRS